MLVRPAHRDIGTARDRPTCCFIPYRGTGPWLLPRVPGKVPYAPLPDDLAAVEVAIGDRNDDVVLARVLGGGADSVVDTIAYASAHARQLLAYAGLVKRVLDGRAILPLKDGGQNRFHPSSTGNSAALAGHSLSLTSRQVLNAADPDCPRSSTSRLTSPAP